MKMVSILLGVLMISVISVYLYMGGFGGESAPKTAKTSIDLAKDSKIKTDFVSLKSNLEMYRGEKGTYPKTLSEIKNLGGNINPVTNTPYGYTSDGNSYTLSTTLSDGTTHQVSN